MLPLKLEDSNLLKDGMESVFSIELMCRRKLVSLSKEIKIKINSTSNML